ncbi:HAD family phosphatase [Enterococcus sp. 669A]|uniref:HAD family phosphatase n=1 Tax=Candidatus Enterococcus moelleringii TaxID=2815325 RepID=A0ABS3LGM9_9ENTE|nr:HAD family phosphatase [Enterococcus sp. 669A]MBO1308792.1 HAD family phosphatase [Enterococcus sp. 669A]
MIKALIFDFDGTMIDSEWLFFESVNSYLAKNFKYRIPFEDFQKGIGSSADGTFYERISLAVGKQINTAELDEWIIQDQKRNYGAACLRDGIQDLLEKAHEQQWKIGVVSNSQLKELAFYFDRHPAVNEKIDVFVTIDDVKLGKPDPEGYQQCLEHLGVESSEAVAIEDSPLGAKAAVAANILTYAYPNVFTEGMDFPQPVKKFEQVNELFE